MNFRDARRISEVATRVAGRFMNLDHREACDLAKTCGFDDLVLHEHTRWGTLVISWLTKTWKVFYPYGQQVI